MFSEICLAFITLTLMIIAGLVITMSLRLLNAIRLLENDVHNISDGLVAALDQLNRFLQTDARAVSEKITALFSSLNQLSIDIKGKAGALHPFFRSLHFLNSQLDSDSASPEASSKLEKISQILKWVKSSSSLIKQIKEFIKYGK